MGWSVGFDTTWGRDIGYGVPAWCDHPNCDEVIDRGLSYVCCDQQPYGGDKGCGLYFCSKHSDPRSRCRRCAKYRRPFNAKPDHPDWIKHKMTDPSWAAWRAEKRICGSAEMNEHPTSQLPEVEILCGCDFYWHNSGDHDEGCLKGIALREMEVEFEFSNAPETKG